MSVDLSITLKLLELFFHLRHLAINFLELIPLDGIQVFEVRSEDVQLVSVNMFIMDDPFNFLGAHVLEVRSVMDFHH
jgi:hypothetical protein